MASESSAAQGHRSTLWSLLLLLRLVVCLPIYAWGVLMALLAGSTARGILRVERTLWAGNCEYVGVLPREVAA